MRMMKFGAPITMFLALLPACVWQGAAQSTAPTVSPSSLSFTYQVNSSTYPAAAKLTASLPSSMSTVVMTATATSAPQGWLAATPDTGRTPLALSVTVNPTGLAPGNYAGRIDIATASATVSVAVSLAVSNPPSNISATSPSSNYASATATAPASLTFSYTTGDLATIPGSSELDVTSTGDVIPFGVTAANASAKGGTGGGSGTTPVWLRVNQSGQLPNLNTSGVALSGSSMPITVSIDMVALGTLNPGSYTGTITIAANNAVNGTVPVTVNLVVAAGAPVLNQTLPIFPASVIAGPALDPVITIYGDNFFSTSVVTLQPQSGATLPITLTATLLSRKVMQATIKAAYLAVPAGAVTYPIKWTLTVMNPAPPSNPVPALATTEFDVTDPTLPGISSVVNSASYLPTAVQTGTAANPVPVGAVSLSPRQIISIFGQNLGPSSATPVAPTGTPPAYPTTVGAVQVTFVAGTSPNTTTYLAPLLMISANQINCIVPKEVDGSVTPVNVTVTNAAGPTNPFAVTVVPEDPGMFTFGGLGQGQSAVLNIDSSGAYTINSTKTAAARGSTIAIYATGLGDLQAGTSVGNGEVATAAVSLADNTCRVDIAGQPAVVSYAGTSPGAVAGLVQVNAIVPPTVAAGTAVPITVSIGSAANSRRSQPGVTLAVK